MKKKNFNGRDFLLLYSTILSKNEIYSFSLDLLVHYCKQIKDTTYQLSCLKDVQIEESCFSSSLLNGLYDLINSKVLIIKEDFPKYGKNQNIFFQQHRDYKKRIIVFINPNTDVNSVLDYYNDYIYEMEALIDIIAEMELNDWDYSFDDFKKQ